MTANLQEQVVDPKTGKLTLAGIKLLNRIQAGGGGGGGNWPVTGTPAPILNTTAAFTTAQQTKLAGIAPAATANATDAALRNRATHTGANTIADTTGLQAALDGLAVTWIGLATGATTIAPDSNQPMSGRVLRYTYSNAAIRFRFLNAGVDEFYTGWDGTTLTGLVADRFAGI